MLGRRKRAKEEAARIEAARAAHVAELPDDVRPLVREGWRQRDEHLERLTQSESRRRLATVRDGVVLFCAVELLLGGLDPLRLVTAAATGALVGLLWIPLVGRGLGLQLAAPLTAAPAFVAMRFALGSGGLLVDFTLICGVFILAGIASWIGFSRDEELHGA